MNTFLKILPVVAVVFSLSCKKEKATEDMKTIAVPPCNDSTSSYRNTIQGNYQITTVRWSKDTHAMPYYSDTTVIIGSIGKFVGLGNNNDTCDKILIEYRNGDNFIAPSCLKGKSYSHGRFIHPTISSKGVLSYPEFCASYPTTPLYFSGQIINDSLFISFGYKGIDLDAGEYREGGTIIYGKKN